MSRDWWRDVDVDDEETPVHLRLVAAAMIASDWLGAVLAIVDEEGELAPAAMAAYEAAQAAIVAMIRAEMMDPWWEKRQPHVEEIVLPETPAQRMEQLALEMEFDTVHSILHTLEERAVGEDVMDAIAENLPIDLRQARKQRREGE